MSYWYTEQSRIQDSAGDSAGILKIKMPSNWCLLSDGEGSLPIVPSSFLLLDFDGSSILSRGYVVGL